MISPAEPPMKYLFVLALVSLLLALAYWRARPYIAAGRRLLNVFRDAQRLASDDPAASAPRRPNRAGEKLARCRVCGTWLPASRALTLRHSPDAYCSHACLERAAAGEPAKKRAGGSS
ncbi:MAG TPA: hypothetical protein VM864_01760 [Pyrinomonadaceae bacterium]|jgi:hypothetical protein|nr:hypothetical protein [Pyrinomonadaceae bacterium]